MKLCYGTLGDIGFLLVKHFRALSSTAHACAQCYLVTTAIYIIGALHVVEMLLTFLFLEKLSAGDFYAKLEIWYVFFF